jgi:hypothetical protein
MRGSVEYQVDFKTMEACGAEVASLIVPTRGLRVSEPEPRYTSVARREPRPLSTMSLLKANVWENIWSNTGRSESRDNETSMKTNCRI